MTLGKLERVDLRAIWESEAQDFTPWLAKEETLVVLGQTIGMELELVGQEHFVGPYRADVLCKDTISHGVVLIENQLGKTDHGHLGQILTYAAGTGAKTVVWIAARFTDEHRAALDWLNEITGEGFGFFALEIELWRIGDSPAAPKFNVVVQPNEWRRTGKLIGERDALYLRYWTAFREYIERTRRGGLRPPRPIAGYWVNFPLGRSGFTLSATASVEKRRIGAEVYILPDAMDAKEAFRRLQEDKGAIEAETRFPLDWQELPEAKGSRIAVYRTDVDVGNENDWPGQFEWLANSLEAIHKALSRRIKAI